MRRKLDSNQVTYHRVPPCRNAQWRGDPVHYSDWLSGKMMRKHRLFGMEWRLAYVQRNHYTSNYGKSAQLLQAGTHVCNVCDSTCVWASMTYLFALIEPICFSPLSDIIGYFLCERQAKRSFAEFGRPESWSRARSAGPESEQSVSFDRNRDGPI